MLTEGRAPLSCKISPSILVQGSRPESTETTPGQHSSKDNLRGNLSQRIDSSVAHSKVKSEPFSVINNCNLLQPEYLVPLALVQHLVVDWSSYFEALLDRAVICGLLQ